HDTRNVWYRRSNEIDGAAQDGSAVPGSVALSYSCSRRLCTKSPYTLISLCNLCVLCVSVVDEFRAKTHHRDTEDTEIAQRTLRTSTFRAKPLKAMNNSDATQLGMSGSYV